MNCGVLQAQHINLIKWLAVKIVLFENISIKYLLMEQIVLIYFVHQLLNNVITYRQIIIKWFLRIERFLFALEKQF